MFAECKYFCKLGAECLHSGSFYFILKLSLNLYNFFWCSSHENNSGLKIIINFYSIHRYIF